MRGLKTQGVVLKSINFGEADKILTIFTERFGKVKVIAKGVRKMRSHLAGTLEPFMLLDLLLHEGKTFYVITGAVIIADFPLIHSDLNITAKAFFLGELIDKFVKEKEGGQEVFDLYISVLENLERGDSEFIARAFEFKLITISGFSPELYECVHCKEKIAPGGNFWDQEEGGVLCKSCQAKFRHGREISDQLIKFLRFVEKNNFTEIVRLKADERLLCEINVVLGLYTRHILEQDLKSQRFLNTLAQS